MDSVEECQFSPGLHPCVEALQGADDALQLADPVPKRNIVVGLQHRKSVQEGELGVDHIVDLPILGAQGLYQLIDTALVR